MNAVLMAFSLEQVPHIMGCNSVIPDGAIWVHLTKLCKPLAKAHGHETKFGNSLQTKVMISVAGYSGQGVPHPWQDDWKIMKGCILLTSLIEVQDDCNLWDTADKISLRMKYRNGAYNTTWLAGWLVRPGCILKENSLTHYKIVDIDQFHCWIQYPFPPQETSILTFSWSSQLWTATSFKWTL